LIALEVKRLLPMATFKVLATIKNLIGFTGDVVCDNINSKADLELLSDYKFDYMFHQAAISDTRAYDQEIVMQTNVNSFYDLLDKAKKR
jgi:ADP-L-glycero-D-manno-heptose 6-epimerase